MIKTLRLFGASSMWRVMLQVYEIIVFNLLLNNLMDEEAQAGCLQNMLKKFKIAIFDGFVYGLVARDILPAKIKAIPSELPLIWRGNAE